jgi:hypothetical protein
MDGQETISVAEVSAGPCGDGDPGTTVSLPVVEVLTGRGFITGKSGSGKSNTASVLVEKLLDASFPVLIVDIDGEYYGLKEKYEILHVGSDEECDIQVGPEHAEKIASLALEENVPIILDVSSFLDEDEAAELLTAVSRQLFAKEKKLKKPFLMIVEEIHEYLPEGGGMGECGKMLIKIGKRGRKHGLGITGISQRPADVKKDFITQCDWLVWHRLTWNNDTKVVRRVIDAEHAAAVEDLDDGEGFLMTDWAESIQRVQFYRKQTFDAGATPGLEDFERPELKSVSDDLVSELTEITDEQQAREDRIAELREELDRKNSRIAELETELQDARDMQRMAEQFTEALLEHVERANPGRTERERMRTSPIEREERSRANGTGGADAVDAAVEMAASMTDDAGSAATNGHSDPSEQGAEAHADPERPPNGEQSGSASSPGAEAADGEQAFADTEFEPFEEAADGEGETTAEPADDVPADTAIDEDAADEFADGDFEDSGSDFEDFPDGDFEDAATADVDFGGLDTDEPDRDDPDFPAAADTFDFEASMSADETEVERPAEPKSFDELSRTLTGDETDAESFEDAIEVRQALLSMDRKTRRMLRYYRDQGPGTPMDAHFAAGGSSDRTDAYARNRDLRVRGFVEHVGRGRYDYTLPTLLDEVTDGDAAETLSRLEQAFLSGR